MSHLGHLDVVWGLIHQRPNKNHEKKKQFSKYKKFIPLKHEIANSQQNRRTFFHTKIPKFQQIRSVQF